MSTSGHARRYIFHVCVCARACRAILLGSRGFDVPKLSQKLETLNAAKTLEAIEPVWETDIEVGVGGAGQVVTCGAVGFP